MKSNDFLTVLGPLARLHADPDITIIMVDAPDRVYVVRTGDAMGPMAETEVTFGSTEKLRQVIDAAMGWGGITLSPENSVGEVRLPDGSRVVAVIPPTAVDSSYLVIRKADKAKFTSTWDYLLEIGTLSSAAHELLLKAISLWVNVLIVGKTTTSGKDYIVNLMAESIPSEERVIVVADTFQLPVARHPHRIHLEAGGPANLSVGQLLDIAAKLRPNWLVIGDLRGPEAMRAIQLMQGGYHTLTTLYADSPEDALTRLESMCLMANPSLGLDEIRRMIASAIGLISFQMNHALPDYRIKITQLVEVRGVENDRYILQPLFTYDNEQGVLQPTEAGQTWAERMHSRLIQG
jgi:pilus assembly protein CpaF